MLSLENGGGYSIGLEGIYDIDDNLKTSITILNFFKGTNEDIQLNMFSDYSNIKFNIQYFF